MRSSRLLFLALAVLSVAGMAEARPQIVIINQNVGNFAPLRFLSSSPGPNETVNAPPKRVTLQFTQELREGDAMFKVTDPYGNEVPMTDFKIKSNIMSAAFPQDYKGGAGAYKVDWQAACLCEDTTLRSDFFFFSM